MYAAHFHLVVCCANRAVGMNVIFWLIALQQRTSHKVNMFQETKPKINEEKCDEIQCRRTAHTDPPANEIDALTNRCSLKQTPD